MNDPTQYPSLPEQGANLSKFVFEILKKSMKGDALMVSEEIANQRLEVCKTCEYYDAEQNRCRHCGCQLIHKVKWALDGCPIEKWSPSDQAWTESKFDELVQHVQNGTEPRSPYQPAEPPPFPDVFAEEISPGYIFEYNDVKWEFTGSSWQPVA